MATRLSDVLRAIPLKLRLEGTAKQSMETARHRLVVGGVLFAVAFTVVGLRLVDVTVLKEGHEPRVAQRSPSLEQERSDIVDRNGELLATSLATASLYANPRLVIDPADAAAKIARTLPGFSEKDLAQRLGADRSFVWLRRNLTPRQQFAVNRLGIPGLFFQREERRVYPHGALMSHIVGFTDVDNRGLAGIEQSFDDRLRHGGEPLQLSIDIRLQHVVRTELAAAIEEFRAIGGAAVVLDASTSELLSMVSLPDFDPNNPGAGPPENRFNRVTLGTYEPGSTFKLFNVAAALDSNVVTMRDGYDASKPIQISRFSISDYKGQKRWLSVPEIMMYSSNIGSARMAIDLGRDRQRDFLARAGMLKAATLELPEMAAPQIPSPWRDINVMTVAFGHGIAVTPLQVAVGVAAISNGGIMRPATLLKRTPADMPAGERIISQRTSEQVRGLMRLVVHKGTAKSADAAGYFVGGKTGTTEKNIKGRYYPDKRISSFVGAFPINAPRFVVYFMLDEPKGTKATHNYATAGWVAAPSAGRLVNQIAALYGLPQMDPLQLQQLVFRDMAPLDVAVR
jgi:cell division protein FtsI (penicillin-binding protein 3)